MRHCTVCVHPQRQQIEEAMVAGESERSIAAKFGVSDSAVHRHKTSHLPAKLLEAERAKYVLDANKIFSRVEDLLTESEELIAHGKGENGAKIDARVWASGIREMRGCLELLTRLTVAQVQEPDAFDKVNMGPDEWREYIYAMHASLEAEKEEKRSPEER